MRHCKSLFTKKLLKFRKMPSFISARWIAELRLIYDVIKCKITCIPQTAYALKNINGCAPADDKLLAVYNNILIPIPCMVMESVLLSKICSSFVRHPDYRSRVSFTEVVQSLNYDQRALLKVDPRDKTGTPLSLILGALLEHGQELHKNLQNTICAFRPEYKRPIPCISLWFHI